MSGRRTVTTSSRRTMTASRRARTAGSGLSVRARGNMNKGSRSSERFW